jgi:acyl-CoA reductase-like NAD-dependent aldehyde dehydrogenase
VLLKLADLIEANIPELAKLEALQAGKAETFAYAELQNPVETFRYYAGYCDKLEGESFLDPNDGFIKAPPPQSVCSLN